MLLNIVEYHFQISCSFVLKKNRIYSKPKKERRKNNQCSIFAAFIIFMNEVSRENEKKIGIYFFFLFPSRVFFLQKDCKEIS